MVRISSIPFHEAVFNRHPHVVKFGIYHNNNNKILWSAPKCTQLYGACLIISPCGGFTIYFYNINSLVNFCKKFMWLWYKFARSNSLLSLLWYIQYTFFLVGIMSRHLTGVSNVIFSFENIWINYFSIPFNSEAFYFNISSLLTCIFQFFFSFLIVQCITQGLISKQNHPIHSRSEKEF